MRAKPNLVMLELRIVDTVRGGPEKVTNSTLTRRFSFIDKRSVPANYHGGISSTLNSDSDGHRSRRNKRMKPKERGNFLLFVQGW